MTTPTQPRESAITAEQREQFVARISVKLRSQYVRVKIAKKDLAALFHAYVDTKQELEATEARAERAERVALFWAQGAAIGGCWRGYDADGCPFEETDEKICTDCWLKWAAQEAEREEGE